MATPTPCAPIRFGAFELDAASGELRKAGIKVKLQPQPFRVLLLLTQHPGEIVTREQIREQLWGRNSFVDFEHGINFCVNQIRSTLGDNSEKPRYVETLARRGYRFIAPLAVSAEPSIAAADKSTSERQTDRNFAEFGTPIINAETRAQVPASFGSNGRYLLAAVGLVLLAAAMLGWGWHDRHRTAAIRSIAVLPLENLSNDPEQEYFADGMTDALITDLAQIVSLRVISRTSVMRYKKSNKTLPEIAREMNVDGIVEGTVQRSGEEIRITAQLIHGPADKHVWADSYQRNVRDVFALQQEVAQDIARQIQTRVTQTGHVASEMPRPVNLDALEAYLQGKHHIDSYLNGAAEHEARIAGDYFQKAIDADSKFAPAYTGLADAHGFLRQASSKDALISRIAAEKGVALAPDSSDARVTLANLNFRDWNFAGAEKEFNRAIELNPNNALAHEEYGHFLIAMGRLDEAWNECLEAQALDPNQDHLSRALYFKGDYGRAISLLLNDVRNHPDYGQLHLSLAMNYAAKGMPAQYVQELGQMMSLFGHPDIAARMEHALLDSGPRSALKEFTREMERLASGKRANFPTTLAQSYTTLGNKERALYWLEQAYKNRDSAGHGSNLIWLKVDPLFDPLRSDSRFVDLLRRVGLSI